MTDCLVMHPEILSRTLFGIVAAFTPGPNNFVAFYSGFNFGILRTLPHICLLYTSPSPRDRTRSRMPSSA